MDFIEGLPASEGKDSVLVIVDRLTNYSHFLPLKHPYTTASIAKVFFDHIYKLHGLPVSIVSDRDKIFTSKLWKELFTLAGVSLNMSSAYRPQSDGQTERVNQCLENYLRCMCHQKPKKWAQWLTLAEFWFNTNFLTSLKATPFQALYGYPPHQLTMGPYLQNHHSEVRELMQERAKVMQLPRENLQQAQNRMKMYADKKLKGSLSCGRIGKVAYKLALPTGSKIHLVFHVSLLKKKIGSKYFPSLDQPEFGEEVFKVYPAAILARRLISKNNVGVPQGSILGGKDKKKEGGMSHLLTQMRLQLAAVRLKELTLTVRSKAELNRGMDLGNLKGNGAVLKKSSNENVLSTEEVISIIGPAIKIMSIVVRSKSWKNWGLSLLIQLEATSFMVRA
ncbi:UNVERIFIED_CONTAM: hypothetical protein Sradi_4032200 [Sesamum radiatum]|uniref:Integrase catalytic domain-containing protein n=1 Tax=Sesamum radiatum TaxID=300843 RepID=A0AAW2PLA8_SESRA